MSTITKGVDKLHILKESLKIDGRLRSEASRDSIYDYLMTNGILSDATVNIKKSQRDKLVKSCYLKVLSSSEKPLFLTFKDKIIADCFSVLDCTTNLVLCDYYRNAYSNHASAHSNAHSSRHTSHSKSNSGGGQCSHCGEWGHIVTKCPYKIDTHLHAEYFGQQFSFRKTIAKYPSKSFLASSSSSLNYRTHAYLFGHQVLNGDVKWDITAFIPEGFNTCSILCIPAEILLECIGYGGPSVRETLDIFWKFVRLDAVIEKPYRCSLHLDPLYSTTIYGDPTPIPPYPQNDVLNTGRILVFPPRVDIFSQGSKRDYFYFIIQGECALLRSFEGWEGLNMSSPELDLGLRYLPGDFLFMDSEDRSWVTRYKRQTKNMVFFKRKLQGLDLYSSSKGHDFEDNDEEDDGDDSDDNNNDNDDDDDDGGGDDAYFSGGGSSRRKGRMSGRGGFAKQEVDDNNNNNNNNTPKDEEITAEMYEHFLSDSELNDFGRHKNSLYTLTRVEVCAIPIRELAGNNYLFEGLLKLSEERYSKSLISDQQIISEYHKNRIWGRDRIDLLSEAVRDTVSRVKENPVSLNNNINRKYLIEKGPGGYQYTQHYQDRNAEWKKRKEKVAPAAIDSRIFLDLMNSIDEIDPNNKKDELKNGNIVSDKEKFTSKYLLNCMKMFNVEQKERMNEIIKKAKSPKKSNHENILKIPVPVVDKNERFNAVLHPKDDNQYLQQYKETSEKRDGNALDRKSIASSSSDRHMHQHQDHFPPKKGSADFIPIATTLMTPGSEIEVDENKRTEEGKVQHEHSPRLGSASDSPRPKSKVFVSQYDPTATAPTPPSSTTSHGYSPQRPLPLEAVLEDRSHISIFLSDRPASHLSKQRPYTSQESEQVQGGPLISVPTRPNTAKSSRQNEVTGSRPRSANPAKAKPKMKLTFDD